MWVGTGIDEHPSIINEMGEGSLWPQSPVRIFTTNNFRDVFTMSSSIIND